VDQISDSHFDIDLQKAYRGRVRGDGKKTFSIRQHEDSETKSAH
jgi:hypothetical protein